MADIKCFRAHSVKAGHQPFSTSTAAHMRIQFASLAL